MMFPLLNKQLQKTIYADLVHAKTEFVSILQGETGPRYGFCRNPADTAKFLKQFYDEAGVPPSVVEYVEAFGSAIPEADKSELEAIDKVFCSDREEPLFVGSVMSNIGYGEAASGISAVTKVLLGYHKGELAGNLYCDNPRKDVAAFKEGRIRVVTDNQRFQRTYAAVNGMSVTGVNSHVLLKGHYIPKDLNRYITNMPRLVTVSGRQESSVYKVLDQLKSHPIDPEELALLHNIHTNAIAGHLGRGYIVLDTDIDKKTISLSEKAEYYDNLHRPLWFVYSGMGSQWAGMGSQLMRIPIFAAAIERCRKVLEPKRIDIVHIITSPDKTTFNNILHSFVGIAAVQIGLTDILLQLGLVPDKIIGHSVGELGCAYADGCLTAEEMILSAYSRGLVSLETPFIRGSMAAVGVGFQQMSKMCPPEIVVACHNSAESCTISGPAEAMRVFVEDLTAKGIFAKEVPCSNIAYHSRYIAEAGPGLHKYLKDVIKTPKARTERWVSTSVPQDEWNNPIAMYSSAEYHANNLLSPVLFEEASKLIPSNAVLVEVAPHGLLQAILKRSLPSSCTNIPLTRRGHSNNVLMLLDAVGKLYIEGYYPKVQVLYPKVEFPVSTGTPFLSNYVDWAHEDKWSLTFYETAYRIRTTSCTFVISTHDDQYSYLKDHIIRDKTLVPFSFALVAAWDTLAMSSNVPKKSLNVQFKDVKLYAQPTLSDHKTVKLSVSLHRGSGWFEIMEENSKIASGFIARTIFPKIVKLSQEAATLENSYELDAPETYRLFYERGYGYGGVFRSIQSTNESVSEATISWNDNWVAFIDGLFQLNTLKYTHGALSQPDRIGRMDINVTEHLESVKMNKVDKNDVISLLKAELSDVHDRTRCGGVILENMRFHNLLKISDNGITLQVLKYVPRFHCNFDISTSLHVLLQIAAENINKDSINVIGLTNGVSNHFNSQMYEEMEIIAKEGITGIKVQYQHVPIDIALEDNKQVYQNIDLILVQNLSKIDSISQCQISQMLQPNTFIINEENKNTGATQIFPINSHIIVSVLKNSKTQLELACWRPTVVSLSLALAFTVRSDSDLPLLINTRNNLSSHTGLLVVTSYPPGAKLISLVRKWRRDTTRNRIHVIMTNENAKENLGSDELTDANLAYNVFENGSWGGEYYLPIRDKSTTPDKITLRSDAIGDINSLQWVQAPEPTGSGTLVTVHYAGINVADVNRSLGLISHKNDTVYKWYGYGMEFSGLTESGERVMGLVPHRAASSHVVAQPELMWPVPSYWSLEDAATVPFAYVLAYYCLIIKLTTRNFARDVKHYSVLVHGGAGALGQAVINIALAKGYRVFTTVSDLHKKIFLLKLFPELNEEDIGHSRDATFRDMVLCATNGTGCNVVICCLNGELKNVSLKCCGSSSTMLDTVQIINNENFVYGMQNLMVDKSYIAIDIDSIFRDLKSEELQQIRVLISEGIALGHVRPLSRVTFAPHEAPRAFRLLAASRHRGRVLLRMRDSLASDTLAAASQISRAVCCHLIICDSSPLGIQLADKLIDCGVKKLHLNFNKPALHLQYKLRIWKKMNIEVGVTFGILNELKDVSDLLYNAIKLGVLEGLYVIADPLQETVIKHFDMATRTICPSLRHFLVLSDNDYCGHYTSIARFKSGLPVTLLNLSMLETFQDADGVTWYRGVCEAVEHALRRTDPILRALPKRSSSHLSLVQQIAAVADLNISDDTSTSTSLEQLGMPIEKSTSVCAFLRDVYNTSLDKENIPSLTIEKIKQLEEKTLEKTVIELKGLEMFYSYVDPDELMATTEMVFLPTITKNYTMRDDEFDVSETFLCIVPGLEGHHARFRTLCESLKLPAFVLQPGFDHLEETPLELAQRYSKVLLKKIGLTKTFYILGYETGVTVALELAAILEEHGQTGTLFCVGDGPKEIKLIMEQELNSFNSDEALQEGILRHMFTLMAPESEALAEDALRGCDSWRARVDLCVRALLGRVPHSAQYARTLLEAAYARIGTARRYSATPRALRSRLVLLRARRGTDTGEECSLQRYSRRPLLVTHLAAPLPHAAADLRAPAVINRYLDDDILKAFEERNLCDSYLMNADAFMALKSQN